MDQEITAYRNAVRAHLHAIGASPVMWEEITPRDEGPQRAYLNGVDRSSVFLLILGSRYGITDQTGYSPTHQEGNRAAEKRIPRLLFELASLKDSERDGRLNDWLRSLHHEISGASFTNDADLVAQLDARLREMAAQSERLWIKLDFVVTIRSQDQSPGVFGCETPNQFRLGLCHPLTALSRSWCADMSKQ